MIVFIPESLNSSLNNAHSYIQSDKTKEVDYNLIPKSNFIWSVLLYKYFETNKKILDLWVFFRDFTSAIVEGLNTKTLISHKIICKTTGSEVLHTLHSTKIPS